MPVAALLISHQLTDRQTQELKDDWRVSLCKLPPAEIGTAWRQVDVDCGFDTLHRAIEQWLAQETADGDLVLVQGEYGITYQIIRWCRRNRRKAIYAFSNRQIIDQDDTANEGIKQSRFIHRRFALYEKPSYRIQQQSGTEGML